MPNVLLADLGSKIVYSVHIMHAFELGHQNESNRIRKMHQGRLWYDRVQRKHLSGSDL